MLIIALCHAHSLVIVIATVDCPPKRIRDVWVRHLFLGCNIVSDSYKVGSEREEHSTDPLTSINLQNSSARLASPHSFRFESPIGELTLM